MTKQSQDHLHEKSKYFSHFCKRKTKTLNAQKILYFTKYSRNAGSSRLRSYQYFPYLEEAGMEVSVSPLFSEEYLSKLYARKSVRKEAIKGYFKRLIALLSVKKYDTVIIEKEIFPYLPAFAEKWLRFLGVRYIVDYDDAIFHNYDQSTNPLIRFFLKDKIDQVMKYADTVVAGNSYLAARAKNAGAKQIEIIPTVIDLERYSLKNMSADESEVLAPFRAGEKETSTPQRFVVGWIGTKSTFEKHLLPQKTWIKQLQKDFPDIDFHIVGITEDCDLGPNVKYLPWSEATEVEEIKKMDVGIMPLENSVWEKGKCAYKLIQYAACGIPGVASDVGMNREVTIPGETGFLAYSDTDWIPCVLELRQNTAARRTMGENARNLVESTFCIQVTAPKWRDVITSAMK